MRRRRVLFTLLAVLIAVYLAVNTSWFAAWFGSHDPHVLTLFVEGDSPSAVYRRMVAAGWYRVGFREAESRYYPTPWTRDAWKMRGNDRRLYVIYDGNSRVYAAFYGWDEPMPSLWAMLWGLVTGKEPVREAAAR